MSQFLADVLAFAQDGTDHYVFWQTLPELSSALACEIEDEAGRIIKDFNLTDKNFLLPKLNNGYYHLRLKQDEKPLQDSLLIISPQKAFVGTAPISKAEKISSGFQDLLSYISAPHLTTDWHYTFPFPNLSDLQRLYKTNIETAQISEEKDLALYLVLSQKYKINQSFEDWSTRCYDFNKINSFKCRAFAEKNKPALLQAQKALAAAETYLQEAVAFIRKQKHLAVAYLDSPLWVSYKSFLGWRDKKYLLNKCCKETPDGVPYNPEMLEKNLYAPIIGRIRKAMQAADVLVIQNFASLEKLSCTDSPFPDKEICYDFDVLSAVLRLESQRHRCRIIGQKTALLSAANKQKAQAGGIEMQD